MKSFFFLSVGLLFSVSVLSQSASYSDQAMQCLKSNGTSAYYETVYETCFKQIQEQYYKFDIPAETWSDLKTEKSEALQRVNQKLVTAYSDFFTIEDIQNMNDLYGSTTGQTMIKNPNGLTKKDKKVIDKFYKTSTGKKIVSSQSEMNEKMQVISDFWCGDIYKQVNEKLEAQGYSIR